MKSLALDYKPRTTMPLRGSRTIPNQPKLRTTMPLPKTTGMTPTGTPIVSGASKVSATERLRQALMNKLQKAAENF